MINCIRFDKNLKISLYISLFVAFINYMGVGLTSPLFAAMLFDESLPLLPLNFMPLAQFFSSTYMGGTISDNKGRKQPLQFSIRIGMTNVK